MESIIYYAKMALLAVITYVVFIIPRELFMNKIDRRYTLGYLAEAGFTFKQRVLIFLVNVIGVFIFLIVMEYLAGVSFVDKVFH